MLAAFANGVPVSRVNERDEVFESEVLSRLDAEEPVKFVIPYQRVIAEGPPEGARSRGRERRFQPLARFPDLITGMFPPSGFYRVLALFLPRWWQVREPCGPDRSAGYNDTRKRQDIAMRVADGWRDTFQ